MKKIIIKFFDLLINLIESYEDQKNGYHIDLDSGDLKIGNYTIKKTIVHL